MIRSILVALIGSGLLAASAMAQAPAKAELIIPRPANAADLEAQREPLRRQIAELESKMAELRAQIADLEAQRAKLLPQVKAIEARLAEPPGVRAGAKPPLLFSPDIERAMLQDGQQRLPRQLDVNPLDLPQRLPPTAPRPKR